MVPRPRAERSLRHHLAPPPRLPDVSFIGGHLGDTRTTTTEKTGELAAGGGEQRNVCVCLWDVKLMKAGAESGTPRTEDKYIPFLCVFFDSGRRRRAETARRVPP